MREMSGDLRKSEADFINWLKATGCKLDNVAWPSFSRNNADSNKGEGERGVVAVKAVPKYGVVFSLPFELVITVEEALRSSEIVYFLFSNEDIRNLFPKFLNNESRLFTVFLLHHSLQKDSKWHHYIATLPTLSEFSDFIDEWSDEELAGLSDANMTLLSRGCKAEIQNDFREFMSILNSGISSETNAAKSFFLEKVDDLFPHYRWAHWAVESRAFMDRFCDRYSKPCLLPFADMLNHSDKVTDSAEFKVDPKTKHPIAFELQASRDIVPGDPVFNSYGNRNNTELLLKYGFVINNNTWESVRIALPWARKRHESLCNTFNSLSANSLLQKKKQILDQYGSPRYQNLYLNVVPNRECIFCFRVWACANINNLKACQQMGTRSPVCPSLEIKALNQLQCELDKNILAITSNLGILNRENMEHRRVEIIQVFNETKLNILRSHKLFCELNLQLLSQGCNDPTVWEAYCNSFH